MSLRLRALSLWLRHVEKPYLARVEDVGLCRARLEATARRIFPDPPGAAYADAAVGGVPAQWAECKAADATRDAASAGGAILYLHGGAFIMGSSHTHRALAARMADAAGAPALVVDYRRAPEHPHPAALEDACAAYRGLVALGFSRIAVAGDSAGGGLAFALVNALRAADPACPDPACVVGFSPWVDMTMRAPSLRANARADPFLPVERMPEVVLWRMGDGDPADPAASPALARIRPSPPPALIQVCPTEILADDARAMAQVWRSGGGAMTLDWIDGAPHAFQVFWASVPEAAAAVGRAGAFIRACLLPTDGARH